MRTNDMEKFNDDLQEVYSKDLVSMKIHEQEMISKFQKVVLFVGLLLFIAGVIILALEKIIR